MASHFALLTKHCPRLDRLYVQLVPRNDILDIPGKMTQVETEDLWMERNSCYALLMRELFNAPPIQNYKYLQIFESGDAADTDAWHMAVEYVKRAGNGWKVASDGVFVRDPEDLVPEPEEGDDSADPSKLSVHLPTSSSTGADGIKSRCIDPMGVERNDEAPSLRVSFIRPTLGACELRGVDCNVSTIMKDWFGMAGLGWQIWDGFLCFRVERPCVRLWAVFSFGSITSIKSDEYLY